jgi:hypothetical protein
MSGHPPSRVASWLLARAVPEGSREAVLGDLHEEYALRVRSARVSTAGRWYWGQVCRSIPQLVWSSVRSGHWLPTLGIAVIVYIAAGILEFAVTRGIATLLAPDARVVTTVNLFFGLATIVLGGYVAAWIRPAAARALAAIVWFVVAILSVIASDSAPLWYGLTFLVGGPLAALAGGTLCLKHRTGRVSGAQ